MYGREVTFPDCEAAIADGSTRSLYDSHGLDSDNDG